MARKKILKYIFILSALYCNSCYQYTKLLDSTKSINTNSCFDQLMFNDSLHQYFSECTRNYYYYEGLKNEHNIEELILYSMPYLHIPSNLLEIPTLKVISLEAKKLKLGTTTKDLGNITNITIINPTLDKMPALIDSCYNIEFLRILVKNSKTWYQRVNQFQKLSSLYLEIYDFDVIPKDIFELTNLDFLGVRIIDKKVRWKDDINRIIKLDNSILKLKKVKELHLPIDLAENLEILAQLPALETLIVSKFTNIAEHLEELKSMKHLKILALSNFDKFSESDAALLHKAIPELRLTPIGHY